MLPGFDNISSFNRLHRATLSSESIGLFDSSSDTLVRDERSEVSRASLVESKLAMLRQRAAHFLKKSKESF